MAPKRRKVVGSVVRTKTTRKVVKETVEVSLVEANNDNSEPQLTQEEEGNRETEEREEERVKIDLSVGKTPTRVIAVQDPEQPKLKPEEQPPEKEPEYVTPPEDVVEDQFPMDEDQEEAEDVGNEGKPPVEDQVQDEDEETQDLADKEVEAEAAMDESAATPSAEVQGKQQEQSQEEVKQREAENGKTKTEGKRRGRKKRAKRMEMGEREGYKRYIHRVLKQVHPELGISSNAITVLDGFMKDMFERLANEANNLTKYTEKMTLSSREVQAAARLVLPGELGKHAVVEGNKAVDNYMSYEYNEGVARTTKKKKKA